MRVTISCRDIYWSFFEAEKWDNFLFETRRNELYQFSSEEYEKAIELYFQHFHLRCTLIDEARNACHHPLLLRFFCEAYGRLVGEWVNVGIIRDIRFHEGCRGSVPILSHHCRSDDGMGV